MQVLKGLKGYGALGMLPDFHKNQITALTKKTLLPGMRMLTPREGFPQLSNLHIGLFYKQVKASDAALQLIEEVTDGVKAISTPTLRGA